MLLQVSTSDPDKKRRRRELLRRKRDLLLKKRQQAEAGATVGEAPADRSDAATATPGAPTLEAPTPEALEAFRQQLTPDVSAGRRLAPAPAPDEPSLGTSFRRGILQKEVETSRQEAARQADIVRAGGQRSTSILQPRRTRAGREIAGTGRGRGREREVTAPEALEAGRAAVAHAVAITKEMEALPKSAGQREVEQAVQEGVRPLLEAAVENPGALVEMSVEQLPRSLLPGLLTFAGAAFGPMGIALGAFLGSFSEEETAAFSGYIDEELARRGKGRSPDDVMELLLDAEAVEALRNRARGRGLGVGVVEGAFALVTAGASRLVSPATTAVRRAGRVGAGLAFETGGEVAGELSGQVGGGEEFAPGEAVLEGLLSGGQSVATVGAGAVSARSRSRTDEALSAGGFEALRQQEAQDERGRISGVVGEDGGVGLGTEGGVSPTGSVADVSRGAPVEGAAEVSEVRPAQAEELTEAERLATAPISDALNTLPALAGRLARAEQTDIAQKEAVAGQIQQQPEFQQAQARFDELMAERNPTPEQNAELALLAQIIRGGRPLATQEAEDADTRRQEQPSRQFAEAQEEERAAAEEVQPQEQPPETEEVARLIDERYAVEEIDGTFAITNRQTGKPLTPQSRNYTQVVREAFEDRLEAFEERGRITPETHPGLTTEDEVAATVASDSVNPFEIIEQIEMRRRRPREVDPVAEALDALKPFSLRSYDRFGDPARRRDDRRINLFLSREGTDLDAAAQQVSDETGIETTPENVLEFINSTAGVSQQDQMLVDLRERFEVVTGLKHTDKLQDELFEAFYATPTETTESTGEPVSAVRPTQETEAAEAQAAAAAVSPAPEEVTQGDIRLDRASVDEVRAFLGLDALTPAVRIRQQAWVDEALRRPDGDASLFEKADQLAETQLVNPTSVEGPVIAAWLLREAQLEIDLERVTKEAAEAVDGGRARDNERLVKERADLLKKFDVVQQASIGSGSITARRLAFLGQGLKRDPYRQGQVLLAGKALKGKTLIKSEEKRLTSLADEVAKTKEKAQEAERAEAARVEELERQQADETLATLIRSRRRAKRPRERREAILARMRKNNFIRLNISPRDALDIVLLVETYIEEGVLTMPEVIAAAQADIPGLSPGELVNVLAGRLRGSQQKKVLSETQQELKRLKQEARLIARIDEALVGQAETETLVGLSDKQLRVLLNELEQHFLRDEQIDQRRLGRLREKIRQIEQAIDAAEPRRRGRRRAERAENIEAAERVRELAIIHNAETRIAEMERLLEAKDFSALRALRAVRPRKEASKEVNRARAALGEARKRVDRALSALKKPTTAEFLISVPELVRALQASGDVGGLGRQGWYHTINPFNAPKTARAFAVTIQSIREVNAVRLMQQLKDHPDYGEAVKAGLRLREPGDLSFRNREEITRSNLLEVLLERTALAGGPKTLSGRATNVAGRALAAYLRASENNMIMGLNYLRFELFTEHLARHPGMSEKAKKNWATYINDTSGAGPTGAGAASDALNRIVFSLPLLTSRVRTPFTLARVFKQDPEARAQIIKGFGGMIAGALAWQFLASLSGEILDDLDEVEPDFTRRMALRNELNPDDPDFLKVRTGVVSLGQGGGYGQVVRLWWRLVLENPEIREGLGMEKPTSFAEADMKGLIGIYLGYKLAPGIGTFQALWAKEDFLGRDIGRDEAALRAMTPILVQEAFEGLSQGGTLNAVGALMVSGTGFDITTYEDAYKDRLVGVVLEHGFGDKGFPKMSYPRDISRSEHDDLKRRFRTLLGERIKRNASWLRGQLPEDAKATMRDMASDARRRALEEWEAERLAAGFGKGALLPSPRR